MNDSMTMTGLGFPTELAINLSTELARTGEILAAAKTMLPDALFADLLSTIELSPARAATLIAHYEMMELAA
jgi:hypothetical protein